MGGEAQVREFVFSLPDAIIQSFRLFLNSSLIICFQMGWAEELLELAKAAAVLWPNKSHQGLCQIIQKLTLLLDSWSWAFSK